MKRDIDTLRLIVEFCDEIANDIQRFGTDIEDFLDDKAYQRSTTFSIEQIGEPVNICHLTSLKSSTMWIGMKLPKCATSLPTGTNMWSSSFYGRV